MCSGPLSRMHGGRGIGELVFGLFTDAWPRLTHRRRSCLGRRRLGAPRGISGRSQAPPGHRSWPRRTIPRTALTSGSTSLARQRSHGDRHRPAAARMPGNIAAAWPISHPLQGHTELPGLDEVVDQARVPDPGSSPSRISRLISLLSPSVTGTTGSLQIPGISRAGQGQLMTLSARPRTTGKWPSSTPVPYSRRDRPSRRAGRSPWRTARGRAGRGPVRR
jgi:hypothetical protein